MGNKICTRQYNATAGANTYEINLAKYNLSEGTYFVIATDDTGKSITRKVQKIEKE